MLCNFLFYVCIDVFNLFNLSFIHLLNYFIYLLGYYLLWKEVWR